MEPRAIFIPLLFNATTCDRYTVFEVGFVSIIEVVDTPHVVIIDVPIKL